MPHGVVLLPDRATHARLAALAATVAGPDPISRLGEKAPAHVSVAHFEGPADSVRERAARHPHRSLAVKVIGLLYTVVPEGDYYVPEGGCYFGVEMVRRPDLDALHTEVLGWIEEAGATPLGAVGTDFRPHITLGMTRSPSLPALTEVPLGEIPVTLAFGELGPYGTFPGLSPPA
ncbi:hypothetical protein [Symbioplanes lichenis]|uniref:hypothetical protein n=1 Tax=Symbioplanes lichenis TaxID=1629072 RepID=UPI00273846A3|nr:hypothetical protein [Actinoplanes lichenis]